MNRRAWVFIGGAVAVVALLVLKVQNGEKAKDVEVQAAAPRAVMPTILASGTLAYDSGVTLMSEVVGRVDEVRVKEGDKVVRGQLLMRLDASVLHAEVSQIEASRRQSELQIRRQQVELEAHTAKLRRYDELRKAGMVEALKYDDFVAQAKIAEVELATGRQALKQTEAQLKQARERLAKTEIRSPIDGKVTAVYIKAGETAVPSLASMAGSSLIALGDTSGMYAELNVDETDIAKVSVGQPAKIVPAAFPDKALSGTVQQVALAPRNPQAQQLPGAGQARTYAVKVRLNAPPDGVFFPGMSCRAEISTRRSDAEDSMAVAVQAVRYDPADDAGGASRTSVLAVADGKAVRRVVEVGAADDTHIEIRRGLRTGEQVIVGPSKTLRFLREGEAVRSTVQSAGADSTERPRAAIAADTPATP
ncbi:MAG TPA: efflux RND transporter periplasmic adaptor subunit [Albitalea sp.]